MKYPLFIFVIAILPSFIAFTADENQHQHQHIPLTEHH